MRNPSTQRWQVSELIVPLAVLLVLVWYTYGILFVAPYPGFNFNNNTGRVVNIYSTADPTSALQVGDKLVQIGPITWEAYKKDARVMFFEGVQPGDIVEITVKRDGVDTTILWEFSGPDPAEFRSRFFNIWGLAFFFWLAGTAAQVLIRPKDSRRNLFIAANYLTALWLMFGSLSSRHLWESSILLHAASWVLLPTYLHLHWMFPRPLRELPKFVWIIAYLTGFLLAAAEVIQALPKSLYALAVLAALIGSIILQAVHYARQPDRRREISLLALSIVIAFLPTIFLGLFIFANTAHQYSGVTLLALPFMPSAYFYIIYRRQMGGLEVRFNRFIALYAFLILFGTILFALYIPITNLKIDPEIWGFFLIVLILGIVTFAVVYFPNFQVLFEKRFLGIKLPYQDLPESYSSRITTSTSLPSLLQLLEEEVFPSLLIRQYAFLQSKDGIIKPLLVQNIADSQLPGEGELDSLISRSEVALPSLPAANEWIRLILPLKVGDDYLGFWLLGRRDPDDLYPFDEITVLKSIANQTAIALSNILQAEQLRKMYQFDVERNEQERMSLALELHDSILNQLGFLRRNLDESSLSPKTQSAYEEVTRRLREIVSNLRPPMLTYGLKPAIEELTENLMDRSDGKLKVNLDIQASEDRISEHMELHLFRIVQEACENALRHGGAQIINIRGVVTPLKVDLHIEDNGKGFDLNGPLDLNTLLDNNHFGLAGMIERARLIGADIQIQSNPNRGTKVHVTWHPEI